MKLLSLKEHGGNEGIEAPPFRGSPKGFKALEGARRVYKRGG